MRSLLWMNLSRSRGCMAACSLLKQMTFTTLPPHMLEKKPVVASKTPYAQIVEAGKKLSWCACGMSKKQPFCDGSHKGSGFAPCRFVAEQTKEVYLCGCKQTMTPPYCDGSHMLEEIQNCEVGQKLKL